MTAIKLLLAGSGVLVFFYRSDRFAQYSYKGTKTADAMHTVLVNNHGSYTYITAEQSEYLELLDVGSVGLFLVAAAIHVIQVYVMKKRVKLRP